MMSDRRRPVIGVLGIQGAVEEHIIAVRNAGGLPFEIRKPDQCKEADGIILPGGESTAIAIVGEIDGFFNVLKEWVKLGKPVWGTCAGMILLSNTAILQKEGGQSLIGGLDVHVCRNFFGSQISSEAKKLIMPKQLSLFQDKCATIAAGTIQPERIGEGDTYEAVFIRAPAILSAGPSVEVLATIYAEPHHSARRQIEEERKSVRDLAHEESGQERKKQRLNSDERLSEVIETSPGAGERGELEVIVAVRQGNILATAFHPELTTDTRWHRYFLKVVEDYKESHDKK